MDIVLVANSPGELSALVKPLAEKFKQKSPESRLILFITPCQYASGKEVEFARKNLKVDQIVSTEEYGKWIRGGSLGLDFEPSGALLYVGGDLLHATLIAQKLKYPAYAYLPNKTIGWKAFFKKFFVPDARLFRDQDKIYEVGDLMVESVDVSTKAEALDRWHLQNHHPTLAFMPGSREWEIKSMLPIYDKIIKLLKQRIPTLQTALIISPFVPMEVFEKYPAHLSFEVFMPFESVSSADLVVTIPGTNTAQLSIAKMPMLVIFPLDQPENIPLEGLVHYVTLIPGLGYIIKKSAAYIAEKTTKFFALPNIKADREVVPEMRGKIDPKEAADKIAELLSDPGRLKKMSAELTHVMGKPGASEKIVETILNETVS